MSGRIQLLTAFKSSKKRKKKRRGVLGREPRQQQ